MENQVIRTRVTPIEAAAHSVCEQFRSDAIAAAMIDACNALIGVRSDPEVKVLKASLHEAHATHARLAFWFRVRAELFRMIQSPTHIAAIGNCVAFCPSDLDRVFADNGPYHALRGLAILLHRHQYKVVREIIENVFRAGPLPQLVIDSPAWDAHTALTLDTRFRSIYRPAIFVVPARGVAP